MILKNSFVLACCLLQSWPVCKLNLSLHFCLLSDFICAVDITLNATKHLDYKKLTFIMTHSELFCTITYNLVCIFVHIILMYIDLHVLVCIYIGNINIEQMPYYLNDNGIFLYQFLQFFFGNFCHWFSNN